MHTFCYLFVLFVAVSEAARLKPLISTIFSGKYSNDASKPLQPGGENVCQFMETETKIDTVSTTVQKVKDKRVCCKDFIWCWKHCLRPEVYYVVEWKNVSKLVEKPRYHCCEGWSYNSEKNDCSNPVCAPRCFNGGICNLDHNCDCSKGFDGNFCQNDYDECAFKDKNNCTHVCVNIPGSYHCACEVGYKPKDSQSQNCDDIDECSRKQKPCQCAFENENYDLVTYKEQPAGRPVNCTAKCNNTQGTYHCACSHGYDLLTDNLCVDHDECLDATLCPDMSECTNLPGSYRCDCIQGFEKLGGKGGESCVAIDYCAKSNGGCEQGCVPVSGSYICTCEFGYYLSADQHKCIDINECETSEPCDLVTSTCVNTVGNYYCKCKENFKMDNASIVCEDIDECELKSAKCDQKCTNTYGSYTCDCNEGFKLAMDGHKCEDINECEKGTHYCSQQCINILGSYSCACNVGYILDANKWVCHPRLCAEIMAPGFGEVFCDGYVVGKTCDFQCNQGYELIGSKDRRCQTDGTWSGPETKCQPKNCPTPRAPPDGKLTLPCNTRYGSSCPVSCLDGYILRGRDMVKCNFVYNRLSWDMRYTKCEEILVCKPNPCKNNGQCSIVTDTEYSCNCTNTAHTGTDCEQLLINHASIPKLKVNERSPKLTISSIPVRSVQVNVYTSDPGVVYSPSSFDIKQPYTTLDYTIKSNETGLFTVSYDTTSSSEKVASVSDSIIFVADKNPPQLRKFSLLDKNKDCFNVAAQPNMCPSKKLLFSSTGWWNTAPGNLVSTNGIIFLKLSTLAFPVSLSITNSPIFFNDFRQSAQFEIKSQPSAAACQQVDLTDDELQYTMTNDVFAKDFLSQYNKITPDWFNVALNSPLRNTHPNNVQTFLWSGERIQSENACSGASVELDGLYFVYLHHEKITLNVNKKTIMMETQHKFCFIVDVCKEEPQLVVPRDNYGKLETIFSFTELQAMGWLVQVKSIGFRNENIKNDGRRCARGENAAVAGAEKQVVFGSTNMTYNPERTMLKGEIQGDMVLNVNNKNELSMNEQCFDGISRFDTVSWFTTDYIHKRYTKVVPVHNKVNTVTRKGKSGHQSYSVRQNEKAIFKMKTGLKQILQTTSSRIDLRMLYREKKNLFIIDETDENNPLFDGFDNVPMIESLEGLGYPLDDLNTALDSVTVDNPKFEKFKDDMTEWKTQLDKDVEDLYMHEDDTALILRTLKTHYFKLTTTMIQINQWVSELKKQGEDDDVIQGIKDTIPDLNASLKDLEKYIKVEKPTKEFDYASMSLIGKMCLYSPCIENVNATLYPMSYDLKLGDFCYESTGRRLETWQTAVSVLKTQNPGKFFEFERDDKVYLCLNTNGVKKALLDTSINILGTNLREKFILKDDTINLSQREMKLFNNYQFEVTIKINLKLKNWDQISMTSYGQTPVSSRILVVIKKHIDDFANKEWAKTIKRLDHAKDVKKSLITNISTFENMVKKDTATLEKVKLELKNTTKLYMETKRTEHDTRGRYDKIRSEMEEIDRKIKDVCQMKTCEMFCNKLPQCVEVREPYYINKSIPECHTEVVNRSYGFMKSEETTCQYQVKDRYYKPTGNCKHPSIDPNEAKEIIKAMNEKVEHNKTLTEEDAFKLMRIDFDKGEKLLKDIQKRNFFINLKRRIELGLVTEEEFKKLEGYKGKTIADNMRNVMKKIQNGKTLNLISQKLNSSQTLTDDDYAKIRAIDPQLEKKIRISEAVTELREKIDLKGGKYSKKDLEHLKKVAPEFAKNFTRALENQKRVKECIDNIQKKIANGTLSKADLRELERLSPEVAEKLKKALRDQLKAKMEKMHGQLKSVKSVLDRGMNKTGIVDIEKQLQHLTGSQKPITEQSLKELQEKLRNSSKDGLYQQVLARLDLDYDIKNITGNSEDLKRVLHYFFGVLTKIDVETILQHNYDDAARELNNVQDWFFTLSEIVTQSCDKCGGGGSTNCDNDKHLLNLLSQIKSVLGMFNNDLCKKRWTKGSKTVKVRAICTQLDKINTFLSKKPLPNDICKQLKSNMVGSLKLIVDTWKEVRKGVGSSEQQFTQSETTQALLDACIGLKTNLKLGYVKSFGKIEVTMISGDKLIAATEKKLEKGFTTSTAQFELLTVILDDVKTFVLAVPKTIEQNKKVNVEFDASRTNLIKVNYKQLTNQLINLLNNRCTDKTPNAAKMKMLLQLMKVSEMRLSGMLTSKTKDELFGNAHRLTTFIDTIKKLTSPLWIKLLPCTLRQEKIHSDSKRIVDESTKDLLVFLSTVKALSTKSVESYLTEVKDLLKKYEKDGIKSPIGKYIDHIITFIGKLPKFNIAVMVSATPDLSTVLLNTFGNVINKIEQIFDSMVNQMKRCGNSCPKPEDIFGKENLIEISSKLDAYFSVISKSTSDFVAALTFAPRGLASIKNGLEFVQVALQTLSRSGTGFSLKGIETIQTSFDKLNTAVLNMKGDKRDELYNSIAGKTNTDVQNYKKTLENLKLTLIALYEKSKSKLDFLKASIKKFEGHIKKTILSTTDLNKFISPIDRRFQFAIDCGETLNEIGQLFQSIYSQKLGSMVLTYVNEPFAKNMSRQVKALKEQCKNAFLHTRHITIVMGTKLPIVKEKDFLNMDLTQKIDQISKSSDSKRVHLLAEFASLTNKASKILGSGAEQAKTLSEKVVGSISKTINSFESFKQNMKAYGEMYDKIQSTIKEIKKHPISEVGIVKDSLRSLLGSFKDYNINKILLSGAQVIPRKMDELHHLFRSTSGTLMQMNTMITKCKTCSVDKVFGYSFLSNTTEDVVNWFHNMHEKLRNYTVEVSGAVKEFQTLKKTTKDISNKFTKIYQKKPFTVNTLKELSEALSSSSSDFKVILNATQDISKVLLRSDVNLDIVGNTIDSIVSQVSAIMSSHEVLAKGERLLLQAKKLKSTYGKLRSSAAEFNKEGPLSARLKFVEQIANESNSLIQELPALFELSNQTLQAAGVNSTWVKMFATSAVRLATLTHSIYNKTSHVLKSAEIVVSGVEQVQGDSKALKKDAEDFVHAPWDQKIASARNVSKSFSKVFDSVVDTSVKCAAALGSILTREDLKSQVVTVIGEKRLKKYQKMYHDVTMLALEIQKGPISSMGVLSDSVNEFVQKMSGYDFGKMILHDPSSLETKFTEFRQLAQLAGSVLKQIGSLATSCKTKTCDTRTLFGSTFISSIAEKVSSKLKDIGRNFTTVSKRVKEDFQGWKSLVETSHGIARRFHDIRQGPVTKDTFKKLSDALVQTADETEIFSNSSKMIFHAIFNEGEDMTVLQGHFEDLLDHVRTAFNKTSRILPKVGDVFETVHDIRDSFDLIKTNLSQVSHGPIEARLEIAQQITQSISQLGKTLPLLLNQSDSLVAQLGVNSTWFNETASKMAAVAESLAKVMNKTNLILHGAESIVKDGKDMHSLVGGIKEDFKKIGSVPWKDKLKVMDDLLKKQEKLFEKTSGVTGTIQRTLNGVFESKLNITGGIGKVTHDLSGSVKTLKDQVEKLETLQNDVTETIDEIKLGPVQKVGKLTDRTKDFVKSLKNYNVVDILLNTPKFAKEKLGELRDIVHESGTILHNIDGLVTKHCPSCNISSIFRIDFAKDITRGFSKNLRNVTHRLEGVLDKIETGATDLKGIMTSVKGIKTEVSKLDHLDLSIDGFKTVASVLHASSGYIQSITKDSSHVFRLLVNDSSELQTLTSDFGDFITDMRSFLDKAGNFTGSIADAFEKFDVIKKMFKDTQSSIKDITHVPLQGRLAAVKGVAEGIGSIMSGFTDLLKTSTIPIPWIKTFGVKLEKVTGGISRVLNRTSQIAISLGETVGSIGQVIDTGKEIRLEFDKLTHSGSIGSKLATASSIVTHVYNLTTHVNDAAGKVTAIFDKRSNATKAKTTIFGDATQKLLGDFSAAIKTVADRYEKFNELSKTIQKAFDSIQDDPIKFATEELPKLFNQSAEFITLIHGDVMKIATKMGMDLDKFHIDMKIVNAARAFYKFATSALNAIGAGKTLIVDFKNLLHSKSFATGMLNLKKVMTSSEDFLKSIDQLGGDLFKNWDHIKGSFNTAVKDIATSTGINFKKMGAYLRKGLNVGVSVVSIYGSVKDLLDVKWNHLDFETLLRATSDVLTAAQSGVEIAKAMGMTGAGSAALDTAAEVAGVVVSIYQIYQGIKVFTAWLKDHCDITYKQVVVVRTVTEVCLKPVLQLQHVLVPIEVCVNKNVTMIRGYNEATLNCNKTQCIYMQNISCLTFNDECRDKKIKATQELKGIDKSVKEVYNSYHKINLELRARQLDVKNGELEVKKRKINLDLSTAKYLRANWTAEKNDKMLEIMTKQKRKLQKIFKDGGGKVGISVSRVEFNVTSYHPDVKVIPFRITAPDSDGHKKEVDVIVDFNKEKESFKNIAQLIVSSFVDYVPLAQYRMGTTSTTKRPITSEKGIAYWYRACNQYKEVYNILVNAVNVLNAGMRKATDRIKKVDVIENTVSTSSLSPTEATRRMLETIKRYETATTENVNEVLQRWQRTSQSLWSEDVGAACVGFTDCFHSQLDTLTALLEPGMPDYSAAIQNVDRLRTNVLKLIITRNLKKAKALEMVKDIQKYLDRVDILFHFCDDSPQIAHEMPLYAFAYEEGHFELACSTVGPASMQYIWKKNNHTLPEQTSWKLDLQSVSAEDEGYYHCEGKTLTASVRSNAVLVQVHEAMKITTHPEDKVLEYPGNKDVVFHCNGTAQPEALFKWWFRRYTFGVASSKPVVLSKSSVLTIKRASMKNSGQYWCELSNGYSSIYSRKAKLMVTRTQPKKEVARLTFDLRVRTDLVTCSLPTVDQSELLMEHMHQLLTKHITVNDKSAALKLIYKPNHDDNKVAHLTTDVSLTQKKNQMADSVQTALSLANKRDELHDLLNAFMDGLKQHEGLHTVWKQCNVSLSRSSNPIDWRPDELVCPTGMGLSSNLIECEQCSPGTFDDGKGHCSPCPIGAFQEKGGQTTCRPCGSSMLTIQEASPNNDDCVKTDFTCDHRLSLLIVLDASDELSFSTWFKLKTFTTQVLRHMRLSNDAVKFSLVTVGNEAKIKANLKDMNDLLDKEILELERQPGAYRRDVAFDVAKQMTVSEDFSGSRSIVLFISQQYQVTTDLDDMIGGVAQEMKSRDVKLYQLLVNPNNDDVTSYLSTVSSPVSEHFVNVQNTDDVTLWSTIVARSLCSGIH